jgi:hypothetical protein
MKKKIQTLIKQNRKKHDEKKFWRENGDTAKKYGGH